MLFVLWVGIDVGDLCFYYFDVEFVELLLFVYWDVFGIGDFFGDELVGVVVVECFLFGVGLEDCGLVWNGVVWFVDFFVFD